jgi:hypothetical protein
MAHIDRRPSPNQTALWTRYELVAIRSRRLSAAGRNERHASRQLPTRSLHVSILGRPLLTITVYRSHAEGQRSRGTRNSYGTARGEASRHADVRAGHGATA